MPNRNAEAVRHAYTSLEAGDVEPYFELFAEDGAFVEPASLPYGGSYVGHAGLEKLFAALDTYWITLQFDVQAVLGAEDVVVVVSHVSGQSRETGATFEAPIAEVLTMRDGRIVRSEAHTDTALLLRALSPGTT